jgi:hypothetical protein
MMMVSEDLRESTAEDERAAIVAWLRTANEDNDMGDDEKAFVLSIADAIEQGAHIPDPMPTEEEFEVIFKQMVSEGTIEEVSPGRFSLTEWGTANAKRLIRTSPEAQALVARIEANKDKVKEAIGEGEVLE